MNPSLQLVADGNDDVSIGTLMNHHHLLAVLRRVLGVELVSVVNGSFESIGSVNCSIFLKHELAMEIVDPRKIWGEGPITQHTDIGIWTFLPDECGTRSSLCNHL